MEFPLRSETKRKKKRRFKILVSISLAFFALLVVGGLWGYWYILPQRHFERIDHPVLVEPDHPDQSNTVQSSNETAQTEKPAAFNVLILGIDARKNEENSRTDVIMVAHIDPMDKTVNLVSVPRDTRVNIPGIGYTKINHAHFLGNLQDGNNAGTIAALQAVSDFLDVKINYYFKTDFAGFIDFVDTIGGVDITLPHSVGDLSEGLHHLDGTLALWLSRERYSLADGDIGREADQSLVLRAITEKLLKPDTLPKLPSLISQVKHDVVDTNFSDSDILSLALLYKGLSGDQFHYVQIPGHDGTEYDPLVEMDLDYWIPDTQAVHSISMQYLHGK